MIYTIVAFLLILAVGIFIGSVITKRIETKKFEELREQRDSQINYDSYRMGYDDGTRDGVIEHERKKELENIKWNSLIRRFGE